MKNIVVHTFVEGQNDLNDILTSVDNRYVRQYGSLNAGDGRYIEFVGVCNKSFTQKELNEAVKKEIENIKEYILRDVNEEGLKKFLEV